MMAGKCSQTSCFPEDTGCNVVGCLKLSDCQFYDGAGDKSEETKTSFDDELLRIPWTGSALGLEDVKFVTASASPVLIGITGVASAGKTTFLALLYCLLRHGFKIGDYSFCGSKTLNGWETLAWYLSWKRDNDIQFPPHTSTNSGRVPGLLHLTLRNSAGLKKDLLFTDAPGEWFDKWSYNTQDINASGAEWIHQHADAFLLFADCEQLNGEQQGTARKQIKLVADRLSTNLGNRPLGLVWSKSDVDVDDDMKSQINSYMLRFGNLHYSEFEVSVKEGPQQILHLNICQSVAWILSILENNANPELFIPVLAPQDLFLSKRSNHGAK
jgi:hypothetical protein